MRTYWTQTAEGRTKISEIAKRPRKHLNKGVGAWKIGAKKYRVTIALTDTESKTVGYFDTFLDAVLAYLTEHVKRFGTLPQNDYVDPSTGLTVFKGAA